MGEIIKPWWEDSTPQWRTDKARPVLSGPQAANVDFTVKSLDPDKRMITVTSELRWSPEMCIEGVRAEVIRTLQVGQVLTGNELADLI